MYVSDVGEFNTYASRKPPERHLCRRKGGQALVLRSPEAVDPSYLLTRYRRIGVTIW